MQGSLGYIIWTICYLTVLFGLSAYGLHRYFIIYLFLKNRKRASVPASRFESLPKVTVQLPMFNEDTVAERIIKHSCLIDYPLDKLEPGLDETAFYDPTNFTFPAGTPVQTLEYKFKKDGCTAWESVGNRQVTLDNSTPATQTLTNNFDNGNGTCAAVGIKRARWGELKQLYR